MPTSRHRGRGRIWACAAHGRGSRLEISRQPSTREFIQELEVRRGLIEQRAHSLPASPIASFAPRNVKDVLVERGDFARRYLSAAFSPTGPPELLSLAQQTLAYAASAPGAKDNPQILSLRGSIEEKKGGKPDAAAELYAQAAKLLASAAREFF